MMTHLGLTMFLAVTLGQPGPVEISPKLETAFAKSIAHEKQLQYVDAIKALTDLPPADQQSYYAQVRLGYLHYTSANYPAGRTAYEAALRVNPNSTEAKLGLVLVVLAQLKFSEAEGLCNEIISQDPGNYFANLRLAFALRNQYKFDQAEAIDNMLMERYPSDVRVLLEAGLVHVGKKDKEGANQIFRRVLLLDPENVLANQQLGRDSKKKAG